MILQDYSISSLCHTVSSVTLVTSSLTVELRLVRPESSGIKGTMRTATDAHQPTTPHAARPDDAELLRQYHRIAHIISARHAVNSERGGGSAARRILSHGLVGFSHNSRTCRDIYKRISLIAHPDKHPMRNAYYRAVADIVMEVTRRANDIVASPSSSDRTGFDGVTPDETRIV